MTETVLTISGDGGSRIWVDTLKITAKCDSGHGRLFIPATLYLNPIGKNKDWYFVISFKQCNLFLQNNPPIKITDGKSDSKPYKVVDSVSIPCNVEFVFNNDTIKVLEINRKKDKPEKTSTKNMKLRLDFYFNVELYETSSIQNTNAISRKSESFSQLPIEIPQSHWVKTLLPSLGYSDIWLVELPSAKKMVRVSWKYLAIGAGVFGMIKMFFWFSKFLWK